MTIYEYKCVGSPRYGREGCGVRATSTTRADRLAGYCDNCRQDGVWQRVWSVVVKPMMHDHWNSTIGAPVSDFNKFKTELRIKGEIAEEQTGIPHKYAPLEYGDHDAFGATGDGIYESNVKRSRRGAPLLPLIE